jgi:hypothetical protein
MGITDSVNNGRSVTCTYDTVARLSTAMTTGSTNYPKWGLKWGYGKAWGVAVYWNYIL